MSMLSDAADVALQAGEKLQAFIMVAEALKSLGSIEDATEERKKALVVAINAHEDMLVQVDTAKADLAAAQTQHAQDLEACQAKIVEMLAAAEVDADGIRAKGRQDADSIVSTANKDAETAVANAESKVTGLTERASALQALAIVAQGARDDAVAQRDAALAELATAQTNTDNLKQAAKSVLGEE